MNRRTLSLVLMASGGLLVIVGAVGSVASSSDDDSAIGATATTVNAPVASTAPTTSATTANTPTTTAAPATTPAPPTTTTSTTAPTTTTTMTAATTTPPTTPPETVEDFLLTFAAAIANADTDFLLDRLHPVVLEQHGADLCRTFIAREILALVDYKLAGAVPAPVPKTYTTPAGSTTLPVHYEDIPVTFTFQGQRFEATASLAIEDGTVRWFAACR